MAEADAGTQLTLLGDAEPVGAERLADLYGYPTALSQCWVRSNFISSLDGGATADGKSGDLAGPGDRALFHLMRAQADVIVVGAGTVRIENYGGVKLDAASRQDRHSRGQAEVPPIGIVSNSGLLDRDMKVFTQNEVAPLVFTCADAVAATRDRLGDTAVVLDCSDADPAAVDIPTLLATLTTRGLLRVLTEGGPRLHSAFIEAGLLDELCLSLAPTLVGGQASRIATSPGQTRAEMRRAHLLADDAGYLYTRYVRATPQLP